MKRFSALVAVLMMCAALCVPSFASNNASTRKWVVVGESNMTNEMGTESRYLHVSPYVDGALYRTRLISEVCSVSSFSSPSGTQYFDWWLNPVNYPDLWRDSLPLGSRSYLQVDDLQVISWARNNNGSLSSGSSFPSDSIDLCLFDSTRGFTLNRSYTSSALALSQDLVCYPVYSVFSSDVIPSGSTTSAQWPQSMSFSSSSRSGTMALEYFSQLVFSNVGYFQSGNTSSNFNLVSFPAFYNASSSNLVIAPYVWSWCSMSQPGKYRLEISAVFSFWVDANKLPSGLQVGDEFPANSDAFDALRDELLEQFPEASENIENGKATIQGWNDTETVDSDVASTSISALNALFQNLGGFLFIISLMVFGAVVLRMLIRKAVDG